MIEPFFFHDEKLFGCYHPSSNPNSSRLLIICPPFFDEYRRSYRALADLANACAGQGVHVLRFDFSGTGESYGELDQVSVNDWMKDIDAAIEEGIALSGANEVHLVGVRFGATLAAQAKHPTIKRYIFWDPIETGSAYLNWLDKVNQGLKEKHLRLARYVNKPFENIRYENAHLSQVLKDDIAKIRFNQKTLKKFAPSFVISTDQSICDSKVFTNCEFCGLSYNWPAYHDGVLVQKPVLEAIARRVLEP